MNDSRVFDADTMARTVKQALVEFSPTLDPQPLEVEFFVRAFRSAIALKAVNIALEERLKGNRIEVTEFDFEANGILREIPSTEFVSHLKNATGLPMAACQFALAILANRIRTLVAEAGDVTVDGVGVARLSSSGSIVLDLDAAVAVRISSNAGRVTVGA